MVVLITAEFLARSSGEISVLARRNSIIIAGIFPASLHKRSSPVRRASVINGERGDEPFTRMNYSPIDSVPVQHLVPRHCSLYRRFPRYVKYGEFNDEKGGKSRLKNLHPTHCFGLSVTLLRLVATVVRTLIVLNDRSTRRGTRCERWNSLHACWTVKIGRFNRTVKVYSVQDRFTMLAIKFDAKST